MIRSTGPALLERSRTDRKPAVEAVAVLAALPTDEAPAAETPATGTPDPEAAQEGSSGHQRRLPRPPGRRGPMWLAALVAGAVVAAVPSTLGTASVGLPGSAADYGLGVAYDLGLAGGMEDAGVRQSITEAEAQARLQEIAASRAAREPKFVRPVEARMTTCYCMRWGSMHTGVDLAAPLGTPIYAVTDGVVLRAGPASGFGYAIWVKDEWGNVQVYGHMRYIYVEAGQAVEAGQKISAVGNEGQSTGPHLHYEIRRGSMTGRAINVQEWLAERGITY